MGQPARPVITSPRIEFKDSLFADRTLPVNSVAFEVVSIKPIDKPDPGNFLGAQILPTPDGYRSRAQSLWATIMLAYYRTSQSPLYWKRSMLVGAPPWLMQNQYAIDARISPEDIEAWQKQGPERSMLRSALQQMLKERCHLVLHRTVIEQPVYALVMKRGAKLKLKQADEDEVVPKGAVQIPYDGGFKRLDNDSVGFYKISINYLVAFLAAFGADRPVVDMTKLGGRFDFVLTRRQIDTVEPANAEGFPWDLESAGLTLKPMKAPLETLAIDQIDRPSLD